MSTGKGIFFSDVWSNYYLRCIRKQRALFIWGEDPVLSVSILLCCVPVKSHSASWVHAVPQRSGPVASQLPSLRPKFTAQRWWAPLSSPRGSAPPLLSLTRIASILALVKLTSSLNYANKAVVICICTARRHVVLGVGRRRRKQCVGGQLIKAPPHAKVPSQSRTCMCTNTTTYLRGHVVCGDSGGKPRAQWAGRGTFQLGESS